MTRRGWLQIVVAGASAVVGAVVSIPALLAGLSPALRRRATDTWRGLGNIDDFDVGGVHARSIADACARWPRSISNQSVFVWRVGDDAWVVFSRRCTDLGCPVDYDPGSACFYCPCHGGIFAQDGRRLAGPPRGPLHRYRHRIRDGRLEVDVASVPVSA